MGLFSKQEDVVSLLIADHEKARRLLKDLVRADGAEAKRIFGDVRHELELHTEVEEKIVYPEYRECVGDEEARVLVEENLTEHGQVATLLKEMQRLDPSSAEFKGRAKVLKEAVEHHADEEEKGMFKRFRKECEEGRLEAMARRVEEMKQARS